MRQKVVSILALLLMAATGATAQTTYPVEVKPGITDADKWSATPNSAAAGETVKANYTGTLKVKSIKYVVPVTAITLNKTATEIGKGNKETLSVSSVLPEIATNKTVTWSSDNEAVATVNATTGEVTAVALGTANITATATDGSGVTAQQACEVTIKAPVTTGQVGINDWTTEGTTIEGGQAQKNGE